MQGRDRVTACFFGEGAVAEGEFHESHEPRRAVAAAGAVRAARTTSTRWAPRWSARRPRPDIAREGGGLRGPERGGRRHGRGRRRGGRAARASSRPRRRGAPASSSAGPTASARTRCTTPSSTGTKEEIEGWRRKRPDRRFEGWLERQRPARTRASSRAIEAEVAAEVDAAVAFAEAGTLEPVEELERFVLRTRCRHDRTDAGHALTYREALPAGDPRGDPRAIRACS